MVGTKIERDKGEEGKREGREGRNENENGEKMAFECSRFIPE